MTEFNERMREREESYLPQVEDDMKRELREQLVSFTMAKIFPMEVVQLLIEAVFNEMRTADHRIRGLIPEREKSDT